MKLFKLKWATLALGLSACNGYDLGLIQQNQVEVDTEPKATNPSGGNDDEEEVPCYKVEFKQPEEDRVKNVDLLFVVDTSGSLNEEREKIANQIDAYVAQLPADVSIRIAVMQGHGPSSQWMGKFWSNGSANKVIDVEKLGMTKARSELVSRLKYSAVDSYTDGGEALYVSLFNGLRGKLLQESKDAGFFRSDAALAVVFVSDENEICHEYPAGVRRVPDAERYQNTTVEDWAYKNYCKVLPTGANVQQNLSYKVMYSELKNLKGDQPLLIASMVYTDSSYPKVGENEYGYGYVEIVQESNGGLVNLNSQDYSAGLKLIGELTAVRLNLITDIALEHSNVDSSTIKVKIDDADALFTYSETANTIVLTEPGNAQSKVELNYCLKKTGGGSNDVGIGGVD